MVEHENLQCGDLVEFIAWRDTESESLCQGVIVKICDPPVDRFTGCWGTVNLSKPFFYIRFSDGSGVKASTWDIQRKISAGRSIPLATENGGVRSVSPDLVTSFFNSLTGR